MFWAFSTNFCWVSFNNFWIFFTCNANAMALSDVSINTLWFCVVVPLAPGGTSLCLSLRAKLVSAASWLVNALVIWFSPEWSSTYLLTTDSMFTFCIISTLPLPFTHHASNSFMSISPEWSLSKELNTPSNWSSFKVVPSRDSMTVPSSSLSNEPLPSVSAAWNAAWMASIPLPLFFTRAECTWVILKFPVNDISRTSRIWCFAMPCLTTAATWMLCSFNNFFIVSSPACIKCGSVNDSNVLWISCSNTWCKAIFWALLLLHSFNSCSWKCCNVCTILL